MRLPEFRGLKYPDEFVIKFFFKNGLHARAGRVLELGCGNGSNLLLFHEYGWNVVGIDISAESLADANFNFALAEPDSDRYQFIQRDLAQGLGATVAGAFDVILLPSVLYYIPRQSAETVLQQLFELRKNGSLVFLRNRTVRDYRFRRGIEVERNGYQLTEVETGEAGLLNVFYDEWEIVDMLRVQLHLDATMAAILTVEFQNPQQGVRVSNSDVVVWGPLKVRTTSEASSAF